ncbi:MAG TPA: hypothetical protein VNB94_02650 [Mycobacteriales bacterium]|nr:hypothetical protein [Mycobacteriales bacterium]
MPPAYEAVRCTDLSRCDYTLIQLTDKGSISLDVTPRADAGYPPVMHTSLYRSDIDGAIGSPVPTASSGKPSPNSVRTARLAAGYYLAEVEWIEGAGSYYALAQLTP